MTTADGHYEYRVCPFDNVTQHDLKGSYNGILGVWGSWTAATEDEAGAVNAKVGTLQAGGTMEYTDGETCGHKERRFGLPDLQIV